MKLSILITGLLVLTTAGCANRKSELDKLWEQGYGYNNPNAERSIELNRQRAANYDGN